MYNAIVKLDDRDARRGGVVELEQVLSGLLPGELPWYVESLFDLRRPVQSSKGRREQLLLLPKVVRHFTQCILESGLHETILPVLMEAATRSDVRETAGRVLAEVIDLLVCDSSSFFKFCPVVLHELLEVLCIESGANCMKQAGCVFLLACITPLIVDKAEETGCVSENTSAAHVGEVFEYYSTRLVHRLACHYQPAVPNSSGVAPKDLSIKEGLLQCICVMAERDPASIVEHAMKLTEECAANLLKVPPSLLSTVPFEELRPHATRPLTRELALVSCVCLWHLAESVAPLAQSQQLHQYGSVVLWVLSRENLTLFQLTRSNGQLCGCIMRAAYAWQSLCGPGVGPDSEGNIAQALEHSRARWKMLNPDGEPLPGARARLYAVRGAGSSAATSAMLDRLATVVARATASHGVRAEHVIASLCQGGSALRCSIRICNTNTSILAVTEILDQAIRDEEDPYDIRSALAVCGVVDFASCDTTPEYPLERIQIEITHQYPKYRIPLAQLARLVPAVVMSSGAYQKALQKASSNAAKDLEVLSKLPSKGTFGGQLMDMESGNSLKFQEDQIAQGADQLHDLRDDASRAQAMLKAILAPGSRWAQAKNEMDVVPPGDARRYWQSQGSDLAPCALHYDPGIKTEKCILDEAKGQQKAYEPELPLQGVMGICRVCIVFDCAKSLLAGVRGILQTCKALWVTNKFRQPDCLGYREVNLGLQWCTPRVHVSEVQLTLSEIDEVKQGVGQHHLETIRGVLADNSVTARDQEGVQRIVLKVMNATDGDNFHQAIQEFEHIKIHAGDGDLAETLKNGAKLFANEVASSLQNVRAPPNNSGISSGRSADNVQSLLQGQGPCPLALTTPKSLASIASQQGHSPKVQTRIERRSHQKTVGQQELPSKASAGAAPGSAVEVVRSLIRPASVPGAGAPGNGERVDAQLARRAVREEELRMAAVMKHLSQGRANHALQSIFEFGNEKMLHAALCLLDAQKTWYELPSDIAAHLVCILVRLVCKAPFSGPAFEACCWLENLCRLPASRDKWLRGNQDVPKLRHALRSLSLVQGEAGSVASKLWSQLS